MRSSVATNDEMMAGGLHRDPRNTSYNGMGMMELDQIGLKYGTDKASTGHDFLRLYHRRLTHLQEEAFVFLEIGVYQGGSVKTWSEYFPRATIVGLDVHESCRQYQQGNVAIRVGDASNPQFLFEVLQEFGRPHVVLDDGSHRWDHQIQSFQVLFPLLLPGGLYIVEDLDTSFEARLAQAAYQGHAAISTFDYLNRLARRVVADTAFGSEKCYDLFVNDNWNWVSGIELSRRNCVISKKASFGTGPA